MAKKSFKKKNKKITMISRFIFSLLIILSIVFVGMVMLLNVVPSKYLLPVIGIYGLYILISGICQCKLSINSSIKYFFDFLSFAIIVLLIFGVFYLYKTMNFMDLIKAKNYELDNYYVVVLKDRYSSINELDGKNIGVYSSKNNYIEALKTLNNKIEFNEEEYETFIDASYDLLSGDIQALFIKETDKVLADEEVSGFINDVEILTIISVKVENKVEIKEVDITSSPFNIYISGIDVYGDISSISRSDVNMIVTINPNTHEVLLTSIPRDYYVRLHGTKGYKDKLTHAGIYGIDMSISTLEDLFNMDINYYVRVNFTTLISMVDSIGGIDIYSDKAFTARTNKNCIYKLGSNHLDGKCSLAFARERYAYKEGDRHRVQNQQTVLTAILNKTLSSKTFVTKYTSILKSLGSSFQTNIPQDKIYGLINMQLDEMPNWNINTYSLDGTDSKNYTYSYSGSKLYVMEPNYTTVEKAKNLINDIMESE